MNPFKKRQPAGSAEPLRSQLRTLLEKMLPLLEALPPLRVESVNQQSQQIQGRTPRDETPHPAPRSGQQDKKRLLMKMSRISRSSGVIFPIMDESHKPNGYAPAQPIY